MTDLECFSYSAGHADEGVCLLVRMGDYRILLDCGIEDLSPLINELDQPLPADWVLCTHAHADHARGLLGLHQAFPELPIYGSEVTNQLLLLNWLETDSATVPQFSRSLPWKSEIELAPGLSVTLFPAGHLPGAAAILLRYTNSEREYKLFYTGDFFLSNTRLVDGFPLGELRGLKPDILILEGTYGTARYPNRRQLENQFAERLYNAITAGHSILLPTPALGLGQELLMLLRSHHYFTGRDLDIWVDGAVATGCDLYLELQSHFPASVQNFAQHQPLFWDDRIRPRVRRFQLDYLAQLPEYPCILITEDSINVLDYALIPGRSWVLFLPERPGTHWDIPQALEAQFTGVETYFLPEHCDGAGTTQLIHNLRPQHIIWVHGSPTYLSDLTNLDELRNRYQLHCPSAGTLVELPVGETFLQPAIADLHYGGELTELVSHIQIALPSALTSDPRWLSFADTGLVEARWQGEELVLRGISQREFLSQNNDRPVPPELECCGNCHYYRGQRCWNSESALYSFKVTADGYCPVFTPRPLPPGEEIE
ncbi:MAG: MBL fold metallo-hydrolase [Microcoleaceae cyanobacterium]